MKQELIELTKASFTEAFESTDDLTTIAVPASLIILGDHTHYNDGIILSTSLDRYAVAAINKRDDDIINIMFSDCGLSYSLSFEQFPDSKIQCGQVSFGPVLKILEEEQIIKSGFNCLINSNIPAAIGLGGVTAHHVAFLTALDKALKLNLSDSDIAAFSRLGELESIGKISNIAHHNTVQNGSSNSLSFFDIRSGASKTLPLSTNKYKLIICDTDKIIEDIKDTCNERISECKVGVDGLRLYIWGIKNLRDVNLDFLEKHIHMIPRRIYSRVLYNVSERIRVEEALKQIKTKDIDGFRNTVYDSHQSLRNEYEIGSEKLDFLASKAKDMDGVISSKMISCSPIESTYNIVEADKADLIAESIKNAYLKEFGQTLVTYSLDMVNGLKDS